MELAFELECEGHAIGTHVGIPDGMQCDDIGPLFVAGVLDRTCFSNRVSGDWPGISRTSQVLNHIFQLAYTVELMSRLWYHRLADTLRGAVHNCWFVGLVQVVLLRFVHKLV